MRTMSSRHVATLSVTLPLALAAAAIAQNGASTPPSSSDNAPKPKLAYVQMNTSKGEIILELNREKAPISVDNFLSYVDKKFYDGTIFHRVMPNFMIQGGGFTADMAQKTPDAPIKSEWQNGLKNARGTIAMARTSAPDSATSQFYINVVDNPGLDESRDGAGYAVFGKVVAGMKAADAIRYVPTHTHPTGHQNVPVEPVTIDRVVRISAEDAQKKIDAEKKSATPPATQPSPQ